MQVDFILYYIIFAISSNGLASLYLHLIKPTQLLSFIGDYLPKLEKYKFLYKSLGGCKICTSQRFADLSFIFLLILFPVKIIYILPLYCLYGGANFYFSSLVSKDIVQVKQQEINL